MKSESKPSLLSDTSPARPLVQELEDNPHRNESPLASLQVHKILVPVDFSEPSKAALKHAVSIANHFDSALVVLQVFKPWVGQETVYPSNVDVEEITFTAERVLNEICLREQMMPPRNARILVKYGLPHDQIIATAKTCEADLIVIGTHGHSGLAHVFLGSTTEEVIRHAPCPVLVVRPSQPDSAQGVPTATSLLNTR